MAALVVIMLFAWFNGRTKAVASAGAHPSSLHSLPGYSGTYLAIWSVLPAFILLALFGLFGDLLLNLQMRQSLPADIRALPVEQVELFMRNARALAFGGTASETSPVLLEAAKAYANLSRISNFVVIGAVILLTIGGFWFARGRLGRNFRARNHVEAVIFGVLVVCSGIAILTTLGIVLSLLTESLRFFSEINALDFLFGLKWSPQTAMRADQVGQSGSFGAVPLFAGTFLITFIAMLSTGTVFGLLFGVIGKYAKNGWLVVF